MRFGVIVAILLAIVLFNSIYVLPEYEQVIITQFGDPVGDTVDEPGLHVKIPFIQKVNRFENRFLEWDGETNELPTKDKRFVWVDTYARWRITDPLKFFQRLHDERGARTRLDDILDGETRNAIANHDLVEVVRTSNREPEATDLLETQAPLDPITTGREEIRRIVLEAAQTRTGDLGIEILDVQFKRINYVEEVRLEVYQRMISERKRIADRFRSEGHGEAQNIQGEKDRDLKQIQSEAYRQAREIIGDADAIATEIYAAAYDRSEASRDFYAFLQTMQALDETIGGETTMIFSTEGEFFQYLKNSKSGD